MRALHELTPYST